MDWGHHKEEEQLRKGRSTPVSVQSALPSTDGGATAMEEKEMSSAIDASASVLQNMVTILLVPLMAGS